MKKLYFSILLFVNSCCVAQDLRNGEISFINFSGNSYEIFVTVYSQISTSVPRQHFFLNYGDGGGDSIAIPAPVTIGTSIYKYSFFTYHTFPGPGTYFIFFETNFMVDSVSNLPLSSTYPLYLGAELNINSSIYDEHSPFSNNTAVFSYPCCNQIIYNPACTDADGDSLSYSLLTVDSAYSFAGAAIDPATGNLTFTPPQNGRYVFDIKVSEWRVVDSLSSNIGNVRMRVMWDIGDALGIKESSYNDLPEVYPTIFYDQVMIRNKSHSVNGTISISDMQGREIHKETSPSAENEETLHLRSLAPGVYFLRIQSGEQLFIKKILKI